MATMLVRVSRLYSAEMMKVWRTKFPYLGLAASALMALVAKQSAEDMSQPGGLTGAVYFTTSVNMSTTVIVPVFSVIFGAMLVAGETTRGTLRTLLVRPVSRGDFLTAKLLAGVTYTLLMVLANVATALVIARGYPLRSTFDASVPVPGLREQVGIFTLAMVLTLLPQFATLCFGFFVSVFSANVATAVGVAAGIWLTLQPAKEFIHFGGFELSEWLFLDYYDKAIKIANDKAGGMYELFDQRNIYMLVATSLVAVTVFVGVSYWHFIRRDLNS
jgi:ABC-type transport system involved in multi-copper enzyme maturation permease subunit